MAQYMKADRKDYIRRLIAGIRKEIEEDPDTIQAKAESVVFSACWTNASDDYNMIYNIASGDVTIWRWVDVELLCYVIEEEILGDNKE